MFHCPVHNQDSPSIESHVHCRGVMWLDREIRQAKSLQYGTVILAVKPKKHVRFSL